MSSVPVPLSSLTDALGVTPGQIDELLEPFVSADVSRWSRRWQQQVWRRRYKVLRRLWRAPGHKGSLRHGRSSDVVQAEYADVWSRAAFTQYDPQRVTPGITPWLWRDRCLLANTIGATRWRQLLLIKAIERVRPRRVLEVGCGNGINLLLLACRFPDIEFTGVELTAEGHAAAQSFRKPMRSCRNICRPSRRSRWPTHRAFAGSALCRDRRPDCHSTTAPSIWPSPC